MKERPIIMSGDNPTLILEGRKTQTRRVVKPQPAGKPLRWKQFSWFEGGSMPMLETMCPYGVAGDRLWVREAWRTRKEYDRIPPSNLPCIHDVGFIPDDYDWFREQFIHYAVSPQDNGTLHGKLRPSIHIPRWASRITLEILAVCVERLQDVSEADAKAEGMPGDDPACTAAQYYAILWDSLHRKGAWEKNPWVWVIEFRLAR